MSDKKKTDKESKKRAEKYEEKLKIDGTLEDVLKISTLKPSKKSDSKD